MMREKSQALIEDVNRLLPLVNLALLLLLALLAYLFIIKKDKEKVEEETARKEGPSLILFIVEDKAFRLLLQNKYVEILNLTPLEVKVLDSGLYVQKEGKWEKIEQGKMVIIYRESPPAQLRGYKE